jgi:hypothetical protein
MIEELTERIARRAAGSDAKLIEGGAVETTTVATTTLRIPEKATTLSGACRPRDPVDDDQGGARA